MSRSRSLFALFATVMAFVLAACGGASPPPAQPAAQPTAAPQALSGELLIWATGSEDEGKVLFSAAEAFMKANPGVKITLQPVSWDDAHAKMLSAATSGQGPDIITGGLSWGIEFGALGGMVDLKAKYPEIVSDIEKNVHKGIYGSVVAPDGAVYAVPWDLTLYQTYYRPDLLKAATGSDKAPATWDELTTAISKLQASGKKGFAMQWGNTQWLQYFNFLYQAGGSLYDAGCTKATINSPEGVKALQFYADLYNKFKAPTDGWPDLEGGLESGDYPIGYTGSWIAGSLDSSRPNLAGKWAMAPLAAGPSGKPTAFIGGRVAGIMSYSKNADVAAQFLKSLYDPTTADQMTAKAKSLNILFIPPRTDFADKIQAPADQISAIKAQLDNSAGPPNCHGWEEASKTVEAQIQEVIFKGADPKAALDKAAAAMDAGLANK